MTLAGRLHERLYRLGAAAVLALLRVPLLADALSGFAKVWLRHRRIFRHVRLADYDLVIDGGANVGEFAALVRAARPGLRLLCVEPHPRAAAVLRRRGFEVIEAALWSASGTACLTQLAPATTSATLMAPREGAEATFTVRTLRLDELSIEGHRILLKLDLQGAELEALAGLERAWSRVAAVLVETRYGPGGSLARLAEILESRDFYEAATFNELDVEGLPIEGDKLWLRRSP